MPIVIANRNQAFRFRRCTCSRAAASRSAARGIAPAERSGSDARAASRGISQPDRTPAMAPWHLSASSLTRDNAARQASGSCLLSTAQNFAGPKGRKLQRYNFHRNLMTSAMFRGGGKGGSARVSY